MNTLIFDRNVMRNGLTYRLAGDVQAVGTPNGEVLDVEDEGVVEGESQTDRTVGRSAVGRGIGAGSVLVQDRRSLTLDPGTRLTVGASAGGPPALPGLSVSATSSLPARFQHTSCIN